jgi:LysR family transcriptional regulator for metE and metH
MDPHLEVKHFRLIAAIAEAGSLGRAADKLFLTQSALSHQLKEIERQLDTLLFARVRGKLVFTREGRLFLEYSLRVLREIGELNTQLQLQRSGKAGRIRLVTESSTSYHWLPRILRNYAAKYPNVEVQLPKGATNKPLQLLLSGKVEVAIMHRVKSNVRIRYIELFSDEVVGLVAPNDPLAARKFLTPEDFSDTTYITHSRNFNQSAFYESFLKPYDIRPKKVIHVPITEAMIEIVKEGLGCAVMSVWHAAPYVNTGMVKSIRITRTGLKRKWYLAHLKSKSPDFLTAFIDQAKAGIREAVASRTR